jgi:hypothetical protein
MASTDVVGDGQNQAVLSHTHQTLADIATNQSNRRGQNNLATVTSTECRRPAVFGKQIKDRAALAVVTSAGGK